MQSWVERTGLHREHFTGPAANHLCDSVTVHGLAQQRLQDEHVQGSLQQFDTVLVFHSLRHLDVDILLPWMETGYPLPARFPNQIDSGDKCRHQYCADAEILLLTLPAA